MAANLIDWKFVLLWQPKIAEWGQQVGDQTNDRLSGV